MKKTPPNKPKPELCEFPDCPKKPVTVLGGYWFCAEHGDRSYEKGSPQKGAEDAKH
jgi:hypothetical protein